MYVIVCKLLPIIFSIALKSNPFPQTWKQAKFCPILKKGNASNIDSYRPISIISNFSKIFESIVYKRIYTSIKNKISIEQHGFMQNKLTVTNLACISEFLHESLDNNKQVDVIYTDFAKDFDRTNHCMVLNKLRVICFSESLVNFFKLYLLNRTQIVDHQNVRLKSVTPNSRVPQSSNLGPLLFIIFMNDLPQIVKCNFLLFADELKIFPQINILSDSKFLQTCLSTLWKWC